MNEQSTDPLIGRLFDGRYQVRSRIARGGMATVYVATDLRLERRVAIKIMHGHLADDAQFTQRFIQEARSAARLAHPNVVNVFDQGQDDDMAYLVMEHLPGITLRDLLREHKTLTSEQTLDILEAVLSGLAAAHKAGIVHRDLKPENVLLADDGRIKIGDFGLARAASANTASGAALLGTIAYLSPELVTRGIADTRSDIYAVGIMMYEMLTGEQPFKGAQPMQIAYQHANDSVPAPSAKNPRVPAELDELVLWATARDPEQRPRDARMLLDQLTETQAQLSTAIPTVALATAKTSVLPSATTVMLHDTDEATQVLGGRAAESGPIGTTATTELTRSSNRRRTRGRWLFALVLVIAALAGGTGWYFGPGPGGHITVPVVAGSKPDAARNALERAGFTVDSPSRTEHSTSIAKGVVISTDPQASTSVTKGTSVTLIVSSGPAPVKIPAFTDMTLEKAVAAAKKLHLDYNKATNTTHFTTKYPRGDVIAAYGTDSSGDAVALNKGDTYYEGSTIHFDVSHGAIPSVQGKTYSQAKALLAKSDLTASQGAAEYSDTIAADRAIRVEASAVGATIVPDAQVIVVMSKGPEPITVPSGLVGARENDAVTALKNAGFGVTVFSPSGLPEELRNLGPVRVAAIRDAGGNDVAAGAQLPKKTTLTIVLNF